MTGYRTLPLTLALFAAFGIPAAAQVTLSGRVVDATRAPVEGASLAAAPSNASTVSNKDGEFSLTLAPGTYTLSVKKDGFAEASRTLVLADTALEVPEITLGIAPIRYAVTVTEGPRYVVPISATATKTPTPLLDVPQSVSIVTQQRIRDQMMLSVGDVVRYVPGVTAHQGENNRDQVVIRGNSSSADFFVDGVRDDVQYYRDLYNVDRVEVLKGPNAMIFGRGGGGGVINRVTKEADPAMPLREITLGGGMYNAKRFATDLNQPLTDKIALRLNGMYENSDSFRRYVGLTRYGISPALTYTPTKRTRITAGYERFRDDRTADRGIPSFQGRPLDVPVSTYFGNPDLSSVRAAVNLASVNVEQQLGQFVLHNRTSFGGYDRGYQNFVPREVSADKTLDAMTAYNNSTQRFNVFNQSDLIRTAYTGRIKHILLAGAEVGRQLTDNFRNTGYFNNTATSILIPLSTTVIRTPITFRQSATDANNHIQTNVAAVYVQDQVELSRYVQLIGGVRFDRFDLQFHNNRTADSLRRIDRLISPRAGIVVKPVSTISLYGSYSVSYLPSSGDQFASLTVITQQVKPEKFNNYEAGVKWDIRPRLQMTAAVYRLNRENTRATDPNDPTRIIQTGSQRTNGFEIGLTGSLTRAWSIAGGYAYQDAFIVSATTAALAGAQVGQVPHHTFSLWNNYQILPKLAAGLGLSRRTDMFAAIDDTVTLPGYTRADVALFYSVTETWRLQANLENVLNKQYYLNADSNTNISPGSPRALRVGLTARF